MAVNQENSENSLENDQENSVRLTMTTNSHLHHLYLGRGLDAALANLD